MYPTFVSAAILAVSLGLTSACKTRTAQCSEVIEGYNSLQSELKKGVGDGEPGQIEKAAAAIDEKIKQLAAIDVKDAELKKARDGIVENAGKQSKLFRTMAGYLRETKSKDEKKIEAAGKALEGMEKEFDQVAKDFNTHKQSILIVCKAEEKK